jgi:hypothetical protein
VWQPGDLNRVFERILKDPEYEKNNITVHSSPASHKSVGGMDDGPWVITLENFLSPAEYNRLIQLGHGIGFERSLGVGKQRSDGKL